MQQPVTQYRPEEHAAPGPHGGAPGPHAGSAGVEQAALGPVPPTHTSQASQRFSQPVTGVQGGQKSGSSMRSALQPFADEPAPIQTKLPLRAGSSQQPKQSQPFGVSGAQASTQAGDCVDADSTQLGADTLSSLLSHPSAAPGERGSQRRSQSQRSLPRPALRSNAQSSRQLAPPGLGEAKASSLSSHGPRHSGSSASLSESPSSSSQLPQA